MGSWEDQLGGAVQVVKSKKKKVTVFPAFLH